MIQEPQRNPQHQVTVAAGKASKSSPPGLSVFTASSSLFSVFILRMKWKNFSHSESLHVEGVLGSIKLLGGYTDDD